MRQAAWTDPRKDQFARANDNLISFFILINIKTRLIGFPRLQLKAIAPSLLKLHIQSIPRLIDKIVPILDKQPYLVI